jgi:hypothetical protein
MVSGDHQIDDLVNLLPTPGRVAVRFGRDGADGVISGDLMPSPLRRSCRSCSMSIWPSRGDNVIFTEPPACPATP